MEQLWCNREDKQAAHDGKKKTGYSGTEKLNCLFKDLQEHVEQTNQLQIVRGRGHFKLDKWMKWINGQILD